MQPYYESQSFEQLLQTMRLEIESLKSQCEFLSNISEFNANGSGNQHDRMNRIEDLQRYLMEQIRQLAENQRTLQAWLMGSATAPLPTPQSIAPATLPPVSSEN